MRLLTVETRLAWAARLITGGLVVQIVTAFWLDALSFVIFATLGGLLTAAGIAIFLYWLVTVGVGPTASSGGRGA